jgi:hypothetical protein
MAAVRAAAPRGVPAKSLRFSRDTEKASCRTSFVAHPKSLRRPAAPRSSASETAPVATATAKDEVRGVTTKETESTHARCTYHASVNHEHQEGLGGWMGPAHLKTRGLH